MSSLIAHTDEGQAFVATDSLVGNANGDPVRFTTKAVIVPHLRMIMAATGLAGLLENWFAAVNQFYVRGVDELDEFAPEALAALWCRAKKELPISESMTTTMHHFGFSEKSGVMRVLKYASGRNFESQSMAFGTWAKPRNLDLTRVCEFPAVLRTLMEEQREGLRQDGPNQAGQVVVIGGEIQAYHLTRDGFNVCTVDRFADFDEDAGIMALRRAVEVRGIARDSAIPRATVKVPMPQNIKGPFKPAESTVAG